MMMFLSKSVLLTLLLAGAAQGFVNPSRAFAPSLVATSSSSYTHGVTALASSEVSTNESPASEVKEETSASSSAESSEESRKSIARERYTLFVGNIPFGTLMDQYIACMLYLSQRPCQLYKHL
jgi:hypothetical protein